MKKARLCLILLCTALLLAACGSSPKKGIPVPDETTIPTTSAEPVTADGGEVSVNVQGPIRSLPATNEVEIAGKAQRIEVSEGGEKDGVPVNLLRILSPEGDELWRATYAADGTTQCGIVTLSGEKDDPFRNGFIYWYIRTIRDEKITAMYMTYTPLENGKYERSNSVLSSQGYPNTLLAGMGGIQTIDISSSSAYLAERQAFFTFLNDMASRLVDGTVRFDTDGKQMQWGKWLTHEIGFNDASTDEPIRFIIIGSERE